jgi:hypothetical protein
MDLNLSRDEIINTLRQGVYEVTFNKVNGEQRVMPCTLKEDLLPAAIQKDVVAETAKERKGDAISVWCTDAQAWRSFKLVNFISIKPINE